MPEFFETTRNTNEVKRKEQEDCSDLQSFYPLVTVVDTEKKYVLLNDLRREFEVEKMIPM